jgi:ABC-2 type transport system permease protein
MKKYFKIFQNHLQASVTYRANIVGSSVYEIIAASSIMILWFAILKNQPTIGIYTFQILIFYYALAPFVGGLTHASLVDYLGEDIRSGAFSNYLLKPYQVWTSFFFQELAYKFNYLVSIAPVYFLIVCGLLSFLPFHLISVQTILISLLFCLLGFLLDVFLDFIIYWSAFWLVDVWCFRHVKIILRYIFGGRRFPLDFFSGTLYVVMEFLPFKFMFFIPLTYFLGLRKFSNITSDLISWFFWSAIFLFLGFLLWRNGLKKYEAFGN